MRRGSMAWWLIVGWWWAPLAWLGRVLLWVVVWPVGLWRSWRHGRKRQARQADRHLASELKRHGGWP